jgi:predicted deacylase
VNDEALSRAFLSRLLYKPPQMFAGSTAALSSARNIPTMVVEIGGGYHDQSQHIANGVRGLTNQLRHLGLIEGRVHTRNDQLLLKTIKVTRPRNGGLCVPQPNLAPGTFVGAGTLLAEIVSPYSLETLETIVAPFDQNVIVLSRNYITRIHPGDYAFMIGDGATATPLD